MSSRFFSLGLLLLLITNINAQNDPPALTFWKTLQSHCNQAYEGVLELPLDDKSFGGKRLTMHVRSCSDSEIKIPFFVGEDKSRTWILTYEDDRITLKHDHRHKDGTEDEINFYGGTTSNTGKVNIQFFPADPQTQKLIPEAATNVWWISLDETKFTYNLIRLGTDRIFRVVMDLTKPIDPPAPPWGWNN